MKIRCHECGQNCAVNTPEKLVIRAYIICHDCMAKVPLKVWAAFINSMHKEGSKRWIETPDDEMPKPPENNMIHDVQIEPDLYKCGEPSVYADEFNDSPILGPLTDEVSPLSGIDEETED